MQRCGEIENLECQKTIYLTEARIGYRADFSFRDLRKGYDSFAESKGFETEGWLIKLKLYRTYGPGPLWIFRGSHKAPKLDEIVLPTLWLNS